VNRRWVMNRNIPRSALLRLTLSVAVVLSLIACEHPAPPAVVVAEPPPPPVVRRVVTATWDFHAGDVCTATAGNPDLALEITASASQLVLLARGGRDIAMPARHAVPIAFSGTSGSWTVMGHRAGPNRVIASRPMTDDDAGRILVLLEGGTVTGGARNDRLPRLRIPNGGASGRDWFECVRRRLFP
jgi:hypothetical protein